MGSLKGLLSAIFILSYWTTGIFFVVPRLPGFQHQTISIHSNSVYRVDFNILVRARQAELARANTVPAPAIPALATEEGISRLAHISHYTPWVGSSPNYSVNCFSFVNWECLSRTSSGEKWEDWLNRGVAAPATIPFWTKVILPGGEVFTVIDRGSKIIEETDGSIWLDLLVNNPPVPFGTLLPVTLIYP